MGGFAAGRVMQCVTIMPDGYIKSLPPATECIEGQYVLVSPDQYKNLALSPFNLSAEDGAIVSAAIVAVWCVGFASRAIIKTLKGNDHENDE